MPVLVFDCEIYVDYFLVYFQNVETGNRKYFELYDNHELDCDTIRKILTKNTLISFNGINFDIPLLFYALAGATNEQLKTLCDFIILDKARPWHCEEKFGFKISDKFDHIDLIEVANGKGSLKAYGGKLHCKTIQDLPIQPSDSISPEQRRELIDYCGNDLQTTVDLYNKLKPQIALREEMSKMYGTDLRSRSDAQIAEAVIKKEVERLTGNKVEKPTGPVKPFRYTAPRFVSFDSPELRELLSVATGLVFRVSETGKTDMPDELNKRKIQIGETSYTIGMGGLHSNEECVSYRSNDEFSCIDFDVRSFYPAIMINTNLYPESMGKHFLTVYTKLVKERLAAKEKGDKVKAESLKIVINGGWGKHGSKWSYFYSPRAVIQTTITGQLSLLMLIEMLEDAEIPVVSANTDGIVVYCRKEDEAKARNIIGAWELLTNFEIEESRYRALYARDVNNYIGLKHGGGVKLKGAYAPPEPIGSSWPNPHCQICVDAVIAYLDKGKDISATIHESKDIRQFVATRMVKGGAVKDDLYLGRIARWYYSNLAFGVIQYKINGYTVPKTEGAQPCMTLPDQFPDDVDFKWYENEAHKILKEIGACLP